MADEPLTVALRQTGSCFRWSGTDWKCTHVSRPKIGLSFKALTSARLPFSFSAVMSQVSRRRWPAWHVRSVIRSDSLPLIGQWTGNCRGLILSPTPMVSLMSSFVSSEVSVTLPTAVRIFLSPCSTNNLSKPVSQQPYCVWHLHLPTE